MKSQSKVSKLQMERLRERAIRKNRKARRFLKKINKEIIKKSPNLRRVLLWQDKTARLLRRGVELMQKRDVLKREKTEATKTVHFKLEKVSERFVKKFGAASCVYRATMERPDDEKYFKVKDILSELEQLFDDTIEEVF
jgi:sugar-specific transcriptional regulator TrmB